MCLNRIAPDGPPDIDNDDLDNNRDPGDDNDGTVDAEDACPALTLMCFSAILATTNKPPFPVWQGLPRRDAGSGTDKKRYDHGIIL